MNTEVCVAGRNDAHRKLVIAAHLLPLIARPFNAGLFPVVSPAQKVF